MYVTGPDVVKTVTNEVVTRGAGRRPGPRGKKSGVAEGAFDNDLEA
jgi:propionyl-CoA carboxylase beta chain